MHAVIKIVSFLVFGAAVSLGNEQSLVAGALLVGPLYLGGDGHFTHALKILGRLRWLFLSILIVYVFFTPGQLLWPDLPGGATVEGLTQGGVRIAALVLLVLAVNWLIGSSTQDELLSGILWCLRPLAALGFPYERLAVRISLTLETVHAIRGSYRQQSRDNDERITDEPRLRIIAQTAVRLIHDVMAEAEATPLREILLPGQARPPVLQWFIPLFLILLFSVLKLFPAELSRIFA